MRKYLYLRELEWCDAWINGGEVPISLASRYLGTDRSGIITPDENLIYKSEIPIEVLHANGLLISQCKDLNFTNCVFGNLRIDNLDFSHYNQDGLILSFCNSYSERISRDLGKSACVRVNRMAALKEAIDVQLGCIGKMGPCIYIHGHQRNHFLKSIKDSWQDEYRIFWPLQEEVRVKIPRGIASLVA